MNENKLKEKWQQYGKEKHFNFSKVQDKINNQFPLVCFKANETIVMRGDFPTSIYFIISGVAVGTRDYADGNEYDYFQLDKTNGSIGLLEILAQKEEIIASITCLSKVVAVKVPAHIVYEWIMNDVELLRLSANLLADDLYYRSGNDGLFYRFEGVDRLRYYLVSYYEERRAVSDYVEVQEIYEKIGNKLGMSTRTVGRGLKKLKENEELISHNRKIFVGKQEYQRLKENLKLI